MALSLAIIIIFGLIGDWLFKKIRLPGLVGMLLVGIIVGPYALGWLSKDIINISADLRMIALIIILLRAGFEMSRETLNKVGKTAIRLSFIPATLEAAAITFLGPYFLGLSYMESAILGFILAAVSPAVIVQLMMRFIEEEKGIEKGIPTLVLAGACMDDVYNITIYTIIIGVYTGYKINIAWSLAAIPVSICLSIGIGILVGYLLYCLFKRFSPRATKQALTVLGVSILLSQLEHWIPIVSLLAAISIGFIILELDEAMAHKISAKLGKIWVFAEIILFVLVGAQVNISVPLRAGLAGVLLIIIGLVSRSIGTYLCVMGSNLNFKERMFVVISYIPKATVQAAIGAAPLAAMNLAGMNTDAGELILAMAVLSILLTAPLGASAISIAGERFLEKGSPTASHRDLEAFIDSGGETA